MHRTSLRVCSACRPFTALPSRVGAAGLAALLACAGTAHGYLGSFTQADGYITTQPWVDVTYFNSGQFGANAGGGVQQMIVPDSGLWRLDSNAGAIFTNSAARAAATLGAPPYGSPPAGTVPIYIVGDHGPGRTDNSSLAFRNSSVAGTGAALYNYRLDSYDFGGITPSTVTSGTVKVSFYYQSNPPLPNNTGGSAPDKFTMSFKDSVGNIGLQWGYTEDNEITWRANYLGAWNYTGIYGNSNNWDGVVLDLDLTNGSFKLDYFNSVTFITTNLASAGTLMGQGMGDFTNIGWQLEDDTFTGTGGKNFFDDFSFVVPAPGAAGLFGLGALCALRRRR